MKRCATGLCIGILLSGINVLARGKSAEVSDACTRRYLRRAIPAPAGERMAELQMHGVSIVVIRNGKVERARVWRGCSGVEQVTPQTM